MQDHKVTHATSTVTIDVSADAIWRVISDFGAGGQYLAGVVNLQSRARKSAHPDPRRRHYAIVKRLAALDAATQRLAYSLLPDRLADREVNLLQNGVRHGKIAVNAKFECERNNHAQSHTSNRTD
jgi:hypothetical protein